MMFCSGRISIVFFSCLVMAIAIAGQESNFNICDWIYCANGGECQKTQNSTIGFKCRCQFSFTGMLCEDRVNITTCGKNPCQNNGICTMTNARLVNCTCPKPYTGARCELLIG